MAAPRADVYAGGMLVVALTLFAGAVPLIGESLRQPRLEDARAWRDAARHEMLRELVGLDLERGAVERYVACKAEGTDAALRERGCLREDATKLDRVCLESDEVAGDLARVDRVCAQRVLPDSWAVYASQLRRSIEGRFVAQVDTAEAPERLASCLVDQAVSFLDQSACRPFASHGAGSALAACIESSGLDASFPAFMHRCVGRI